MNVNRWRRELDAALPAVRDAVLLARNIRQHSRESALLKADRSPVTVADFAVQALVAYRLSEECPDDPLVAEEDATALRGPAGKTMLDAVVAALRRPAPRLDSSGVLDLIDRGRAAPAERFWTLDPVDGTKGFLRGGQYVVALALIVDGRVEIGLLGCPELSWRDGEQQGVGSIAYAIRERGAFCSSLTGEDVIPLQVSGCREPRSARVLRSFEAQHIDLDTFNAILQRLGVETPPTLMDSQLKHLVVAAGEADVLIRVPATESFREKIWDQAAGCLIVEEAGGQATDLAGAALDFSTGRLLSRNRGVIVSNGRLHDAVLDAVRAVATDNPNHANRTSGALS